MLTANFYENANGWNVISHKQHFHDYSCLCTGLRTPDENGDSSENMAKLHFATHRLQCVAAAAGPNKAKEAVVKNVLDTKLLFSLQT